MIGDDHVLVAQSGGRAGHVAECRAPVGPVRVEVAVASERLAHRRPDAGVGTGPAVELGEVGARPPGNGVGDDRSGRGADPCEVVEGAGGRHAGQLFGVELCEDGSRVAEGAHLLWGGETPVE